MMKNKNKFNSTQLTIIIVSIFLLFTAIFNVFTVLQPYQYQQIFIYENTYNDTIYDFVDTIKSNCGSTHITKCLNNEEPYCVFREITKGEYSKYERIPLSKCLN